MLLTNNSPASEAGSNDASGTLRVHTDGFSLYNVDVENSYGDGGQAIAVSQQATQAGFYGSSFIGFQDTVLANSGTQVRHFFHAILGVYFYSL